VILQHRPWALLRARIEPTEILCVAPVVTIERDMRSGEINLQQLLPLIELNSSGPSGAPLDLPSIHFRECTFRIIKVDGSLRQTEEKHIDMSVLPSSRESCRFIFEEQHRRNETAIQGSVAMNLRTGEKVITGSLPIEDTVIAMPQSYIRWLDQYNIRGAITFTGKPAADQTGTWELKLVDASLTMPALQGGLAPMMG